MDTPAPISVHPEATLGWRVAVYWSGDDAWFRGHISAFDASSGELHVEYDDGDRDTIVLGVDRERIAGQYRAERSQCVCLVVWHVTRARRPRDASRVRRSGRRDPGIGAAAILPGASRPRPRLHELESEPLTKGLNRRRSRSVPAAAPFAQLAGRA